MLLGLLAQAISACGTASEARHFDLIIRNGEIVDGSGAAPYRADLAINADEIVAIGHFPAATADRVVDAGARVIVPGFIDMHAHVLDGDAGRKGLLSADIRRRAAQNYVAQGVTTAVTNPDGAQEMPLDRLRARLQRHGIGLNVVMMNGHSGMRELAMHSDVNRPASAAEIRAMQSMLRRGLAEQGSFGMSLGVEYEPARYASVDEEIGLGRVLEEYNGVFIPHLRSQGIAPMWYLPSRDRTLHPPTLDDSISETLQVAQTTGATVVFTHMKAWGPGYRGEAQRIITRLEAARAQGARIYMDVYPYDSSASDGDFVALPPWIFGEHITDYRQALETTLKGLAAGQQEDLAADVRHQIALKGGAENIRVLEFPNENYSGKTYAELMALRGLDEVALAVALQREGDPHVAGGARMRSFSMSEDDIERFYQLDWCAVSTDGWIVLPEEAVGKQKYVDTNRRLFGSYPRRLAHYVLERNVDTLEHAVRSMSGLPAHILNLNDRGQLRVGYKADIVVLNLRTLRDNTTYLEPSVYPSGVDYVIVNGRFAVDGGKRTLELAGRVLQPAGRHAAGVRTGNRVKR